MSVLRLLVLALAGVVLTGAAATSAMGDAPSSDLDAPHAPPSAVPAFEASAPGLSAFEAAHPMSTSGPSFPGFQQTPTDLYSPMLSAAQISQLKAEIASRGSASAAAAPATLGGGTFGMADAQGQFLTYYSTSLFSTLETHLPVTDVRFFVPWDAFGTSTDGSTCTDDGIHKAYTTAQTTAQSTLYFSLVAASIDGLDPMISLTSNGPTQLVSGDTGQPTNAQYDCAFAGLIATVHNTWNLSSFVHEYELYNEPDIAGLCPVPGELQGQTADASDYFVDAAFLESLGGWNDNLIAGAFGGKAMNEELNCDNTQSYETTYLNAVSSDYYTDCATYNICAFPAAVSGHPYADVDDSYSNGNTTAETSWLVTNARNALSVSIPIWLTEAAVWQTDTSSPTSGLATLCPAGPGHSDRDPNDNAPPNNNGTPSACVDDNGLHQATAAEGFLHLASVSGVTRVYWYQFTQNLNFDSALVSDDNMAASGQPSTNCPVGTIFPTGCAGQPRPSYCVLAFHASETASGCASLVSFNDYHTVLAGTYSTTSCASKPSFICCVIGPVGSSGTPFNAVPVTDDDWLDPESGQPDPCFRQTGGQG